MGLSLLVLISPLACFGHSAMQLPNRNFGKIAFANEIIVEDKKNYNYCRQTQYCPKQKLLIMLIKNSSFTYSMDHSPDLQNAVLEIFDITTFEKVKQVKFQHEWNFTYFDEDRILLYQTKYIGMENQQPQIFFFDLNKLEKTETFQIPLPILR